MAPKGEMAISDEKLPKHSSGCQILTAHFPKGMARERFESSCELLELPIRYRIPVKTHGNLHDQHTQLPYFIMFDDTPVGKGSSFGMEKNLETAQKYVKECQTSNTWHFCAGLHGAYRQTAYATIELILSKYDPVLWSRDAALRRLAKYTALLVNIGYPAIRWLKTGCSIRLASQVIVEANGAQSYRGTYLYVKKASRRIPIFSKKLTALLLKANRLSHLERNFPVEPKLLQEHLVQVQKDVEELP